MDKLCNRKKPTGDPSCSPDVRGAKQIAQDIQGTIATKLLEDDIEDGNANSSVQGEDTEVVKKEAGIGAREKLRPIGMAGLHAKNRKTEDHLLRSVESIKDYMGAIAKSITSASCCTTKNADQELIIANALRKEFLALKVEFNQRITDMNYMMSSMRYTLSELVGKLSGMPSGKNG